MSRIIKVLKTTLKGTLSTTALTMTVQKFHDSKGVELVTADFDGNFVVVITQGTKIEMLLCTAITQNSADGTAILTIDSAGRHLNPKSPWTGGATGERFTTGAEVIVTNDPRTMSRLANIDFAQTWALLQTFTVTPKSSGVPTANDDLVNKLYADALVLGSLATLNVIVPATAGETVASGNLVYYDITDKEWKLCDADIASTVENVMLAIAQGGGTNGNPITGGVLLKGMDTKQSGMIAGDFMYASNTAGAISSSAGTEEVTVGVAKSATDLYFNPRFNQMITEDEQDALAGTSGTPSASNKFVTNDDTTNFATITGTTLAFVDSNPDTITDSGSGFVTAQFRQGQSITVSGSGSNNGTYTIESVVAGTITLITGDTLVAEPAGATVTITTATANKLLRLKSDSKLPAVDASNITGNPALDASNMTGNPALDAGNMTNIPTNFATGQTSRSVSAGTGTQNIAHGLGVVPKLIVIHCMVDISGPPHSIGTATSISDETCTAFIPTQSGPDIVRQYPENIIVTIRNSNENMSFVNLSALDATNITLNWTSNNGGNKHIQWQAFA